jgi:hypothetical protein
MGVEPNIDIPKAVELPNVSKHHAPQLVPALEVLRAVIAVVLVHDALKLESRHKPQEFSKDVGAPWHGSVPA